MALTPNDILQKEFDNKFRGYDPDQVNDYFIVYIHGNFNHCDCSSLNREHEEAQQQETRYLIQVSPPPGYSASPPQRIATHT